MVLTCKGANTGVFKFHKNKSGVTKKRVHILGKEIKTEKTVLGTRHKILKLVFSTVIA